MTADENKELETLRMVEEVARQSQPDTGHRATNNRR